ncbi:PREDICTED: uncharacterized protein LOC109314216 isoform X2 [Crocodylus porosus]|uniref:uncharacterized protein LOC109314216 isoform X2 n=1 Tax=Crocodylus porosus TaxID=8502 RepID=UPI00093DBDEC|nr:PREDICTED: uncharacterized protein LOC109314216 isoform X2 [Crocodylus porosus]
MGRKKKTLHDYAAEFTDLGVRRHLLEPGAGPGPGPAAAVVVETLYCKSCELPMRVRRDRILEHLSSGRHYRNRRLLKQHGPRAPALASAGSDLGAGLPMQLDTPSLLSQPSFIFSPNPCITSDGTSTSYSMVPSPPSYHKSLIPVHLNAISSTTNVLSAREDQTPSTSTSYPSAFAALHLRNTPASSKQNNQKLVISEASNSAICGGAVGQYTGTGTTGSNIGLALFGVGLGNKALFQSLMEENSCCLLYIVEDQLLDVERAFSTEFLANTRVLRQQDADIVLNDQRVSGAIICSPPEAASEIVLDALRAGKGVFCEKLPSLDRQTAEACFDEADRCGRPLVCGFYKRFDPAMQFLYKKVHDSQALGRIHRISTVGFSIMLLYMTLILSVCYWGKVHQIQYFLWDMHSVQVHGSQGSLRVDNQNPLGITEHGTSVSICSQTQADRYRDAYRELFRHFLRTLKGNEPPVITKEQFLWTIQVAAAAEQSWRNGSAVDLRNEAIDVAVIKTEIM